MSAALVLSGFDWWYFEHTRGALQELALPAAIIGFFVPVIAPVMLYAVGDLRKRAKIKVAGIILAQAEIIAWVISSIYKALTGRIQPEFFNYTQTADYSHNFNFGFLQHGIFWGWPSSHTAVAFALAAALIVFYPRSVAVRILAVLYALYIGLSVSVSIHWFSDFIAGAIVGSVAGVVVARQSRKRLIQYL